jgi:hypothetical protein
VCFKNGDCAKFQGLDEGSFNLLKASGSKGAVVNALFKHWPYRKTSNPCGRLLTDCCAERIQRRLRLTLAPSGQAYTLVGTNNLWDFQVTDQADLNYWNVGFMRFDSGCDLPDWHLTVVTNTTNQYLDAAYVWPPAFEANYTRVAVGLTQLVQSARLKPA